MITYTTLNKIRNSNPSTQRWKKLLHGLGKTGADDEMLPLSEVLRINGLSDAVWCLRTLGPEHYAAIVLFAVNCAESVLYIFETRYPNDTRPRQAIVASRLSVTTSAEEAAEAAEAAASAAEKAAEEAIAQAEEETAAGGVEAAWATGAAWAAGAAEAAARAAWAAGLARTAARAEWAAGAAEAAARAEWAAGLAAELAQATARDPWTPEAAWAARATMEAAWAAEAASAAGAAEKKHQIVFFKQRFCGVGIETTA